MTICTVVEEVEQGELTLDELKACEGWQWTPEQENERIWEITPTIHYNRDRGTFLRIKQTYTVPDAKPRKPVPALPVEVYSSKQFDSQAAWDAIVALSRGS